MAEARPTAVVLHAGGKRSQPDPRDVIQQLVEEAYRKLLNSGYLLAVDGQPLLPFKTIVRVHKANGIKLIQIAVIRPMDDIVCNVIA